MKQQHIIALTLALVILFKAPCSAQINVGGQPLSWQSSQLNLEEPANVVLPEINLNALKAEDEKDEKNGLPPRFGYPHEVNFSLSNSGTWSQLENGDRIWRLSFECKDALSINLLFSKFWLPAGAKMYLYNMSRTSLLGGFTEKNNKGTRDAPRGFGTGLVYGSKAIIELYEPREVQGFSVLDISTIVQGYRYIRIPGRTKKNDDFGGSGNCQVNINCVEGDAWQDEKRGVAMILVGGSRICTGSLVNNTANNGDLLFLTADHCLPSGLDAVTNSNADDWSFVWEYEAPGCIDPVTEPTLLTTNGAVLIANNSTSDFALFRLDESPFDLTPPVPAFFNGWSRTNTPMQGGVGIHHPSADIKKIATHDMTPNTSGLANHWHVEWQATVNGYSVTEGGSSGSPLFMDNSLIIGQLHGGSTNDCSDPENDPGEYGQLHISWDGAESARRLRDWLDPLNTDEGEWEGGYFDQCIDEVSVTNPIHNGGIIQASGHIIASSSIDNSANVEMNAGEYIQLLNGFSVSDNAFFHGRIEACTLRFIPPVNKGEAPLPVTSVNTEFASFNIYPNPTSSAFTVSISSMLIDEAYITIYDLVGSIIKRQRLGELAFGKQEYTLSMEGYAAGTYTIEVKTHTSKQSRNLILLR